MTYRAKPITQRDGSSLANSNCRMASGATGLDYDTLGAETSTGSKMRSYTSDQSGGTSSSDIDEAWHRGYDQNVRVMDGHTFDDALDDLRDGRLVHLDVWHKSAGGPCLSGSGAYGHTMAVAPEKSGSKWLVADPWCSPAKWVWWEESKLRAGAEEWGDQVFTATRGEPDYEDASPAERRVILLRVIRRLMSRAHPGAEHPEDETGGGSGGPILYTTTAAHAVTGGDVGIYWSVRLFEDPGITLYMDSGLTDKMTDTVAGGTITQLGAKAMQDGDGYDNSVVAVLVNTGGLRDDGAKTKAVAWCRKSDLGAELPTDNAWDDSAWALLQDATGRFPGAVDCDAALADRDAEWVAWVMDGAPSGDV